MGTSPSNSEPPSQEPPPELDDRQILASFPRGDGREELRVIFTNYQGHPYVSIRIWQCDDGGAWWPVKGKGVSVRVGEACGVADALAAVGGWTEEAEEESRLDRMTAEQLIREADRRGCPLELKPDGGIRFQGGFNESLEPLRARMIPRREEIIAILRAKEQAVRI